MSQDTRTLLGLLLLAAALFAANIGGYDLWPPDEPRYAEVAREMVESGDFLVPRVNGETYTEKPPLLFWFMAVCALPFGSVNEWAARFPSILSGLYVVGLTFILGRALFGAAVARWACLILMTSLGFWLQTRTGQIDMLLAACMLTVLYAFWRWENERRSVWLLLAYTAMGAGMLAKGPPALVFPLLFLAVFYWKNNAGRKRTHWFLGTLAAVALTMLWFVPARMAGADSAETAVESGMAGNLFRNTIGRFVLGVSKAQPPWYYLETLPRDFLPWTLICPPLLYWAWKNRKSSHGMWLLYSWTLPALVFFSISIGKRGLYLVPLFPAIALILAVALHHTILAGHLTWLRRGAALWSAILLLFGLLPLALPFAPIELQHPARIYALAGVAVAAGVAGLVNLWKGRGERIPAVMTGQMAVFLITVTFTAYPEINQFKSARPICAPVRQLAEQGVDFRLYSFGFSREEYVYYSRHFHEPVFMELIGNVPPEKLLEQATLQRDARKQIARAVEDIPVADLARVSPAEQAALLAAINETVQNHEKPEAIRAFEGDLEREIHTFIEAMAGDQPALAFIQEEDWRWLVPLYREPLPLQILVDRPVGSRHVLLLANAAASALISGTT